MIYPTPSKNLNIIPAWKVLNDEYDSSYFEGKITIVGTSASGLFDLRSNAIEQNVPGVTIVAQFVQQIFSNTFLKRPDWLLGLEFLAGLVISVLMTIIIQRNGPVGGLAVFALGNGSVVYASYYFFINHQYLVDPISPLVICLVAYLAVSYTHLTLPTICSV